MNTRWLAGRVVVASLIPVCALAQVPSTAAPVASQYTDAVNGLSLEQALAMALEREPSLRAARAQIDVTRGMRRQAELRPNPTVTVERREEPAGTDNQTMVTIQWPLDLFRRSGRIAVAEHEVAATELAVADRERMLAADVRMRYGDVLAAVRDLMLMDELVAATERQHGFLQSRVEEGATPPLDLNLLDVELRRLESDRLLQMGRTEAALIELKRVLGTSADATVMVRETLEGIVQRESSSVLSSDPASTFGARSDVREAEARMAIAEARIERARREGLVDVSIFGNYTRMDAGFPQRAVGTDGGLERVRGLFHYVSAGAMVTVPLLNRNQGEIAAARAERAGAAAAYDAAQLTAQTEIAVAQTRDAHARQAVRLYGAGVQTLARQNLSVVEQSYELGRVTVFDVLAEQRRYLDVERAYTEALRAAYEARTALQRARGDLP